MAGGCCKAHSLKLFRRADICFRRSASNEGRRAKTADLPVAQGAEAEAVSDKSDWPAPEAHTSQFESASRRFKQSFVYPSDLNLIRQEVFPNWAF